MPSPIGIFESEMVRMAMLGARKMDTGIVCNKWPMARLNDSLPVPTLETSIRLVW